MPHQTDKHLINATGRSIRAPTPTNPTESNTNNYATTKTMNKRRSNSGGAGGLAMLACCLAALLALLAAFGPLAECQEALSIESRQAKEQAASENELADTIKYLEKLENLDKYWSEVARPR
jgi:uncharacterized protein HemX